MRLIDGDAIGKDILQWMLCADPAEERIYKRLLDRLALAPTITVKVAEKKQNENPADEDYSDSYYRPIIEHLNQKAGTKYRWQSQATQRCIKARIDAGFKPEDFFCVIDKMCAEWCGTKMAQYLRPETLFGNKFEGYLNAQFCHAEKKPAQPMGSFDTDDFFEAALARSQERGA